jgi:hypothetical protein
MNGLEQERLMCSGIDIAGLNLCDRERIEQIGFGSWLAEVCDAPALKPEKISDARLCRSGPKCLKAVRRRAASVTGRSQFCSSACAASYNARLRRKDGANDS